jgi:hypothetical protein
MSEEYSPEFYEVLRKIERGCIEIEEKFGLPRNIISPIINVENEWAWSIRTAALIEIFVKEHVKHDLFKRGNWLDSEKQSYEEFIDNHSLGGATGLFAVG